MGSDRWSTELEIYDNLPEIRQMEEPCPVTRAGGFGGPVLSHKNGVNRVYTGEGHSLYLGISGVGKSRRGILGLIRSLIYAKENYVVVDPKGEHYRGTAYYAKKAGYNIRVVNFRDINESIHYNPLALIYELYHSGDLKCEQIATEKIEELAHALFVVNEKADPFWAESARSLFIGVIYALLDIAEPEQINMASAYQFVARGDERMGISTRLKEFVEKLPPDSLPSMLLQSYVTTANDTRAGIRSTYLEGISMFAKSQGVSEMTGSDDLHINDITGDKLEAIYIILPDEHNLFQGLSSILLGQLMSHYIRIAQKDRYGVLRIRHNIIIEELGSVGKSLPNLPHTLSAGRSRNLRVHMVLQSLSQLSDLFSPANATTILSNADVMIAFRTNNWDTLVELSRKCGEREIEIGDSIAREPLCNPTQLAAMEVGQALCIVSGKLKFVTWLPDYTEMFDCSDWMELEPERRVCDKKPETFNIAEYVTALKRKELIERQAEAEAARKSNTAPESTEYRASPLSSGEPIMPLTEDQRRRLMDRMEDGCKKDREAKKEEKYSVLMLSCGENRRHITQIITIVCHMKQADANRIIECLPQRIPVPGKDMAKALATFLGAEGCVAAVEVSN